LENPNSIITFKKGLEYYISWKILTGKRGQDRPQKRVKEMKTGFEQKMKEYRILFDLLNTKARISYSEIADVLGVDIRTARDRLKEALGKRYITGPQIRKKSFSNLKNYMYLVRSRDPIGLFEELAMDQRVFYHGLLDGFCNLRVVSTEELDIKGTICGGPSSDYYVTYPPDQTWEISNQNMWDLVRKFDPDDYTPKGYIKTHWDELAEWSDTDEILFQEFKYNLRFPLQPVVKKHRLWRGSVYDWLKRLPHYCTILTCYFRDSLTAHDPYLFIFETDYEDFIIDLFSQLPTTCWFQRVSGKLIAHMWTLMRPVEQGNVRIRELPELQIPLMIRDLIMKGVLKSENHAVFKCYWRQKGKGK
jgi:hypothetical protein